MEMVFQLCVIFLVGLIAYWWANQGFFSSLLHFTAVVCAGTLALAFWEPLVTGVLLRNGFFDSYAWGGSLIIMFGVGLVLIRYAFDKLAPANVMVPHWANLTFGGVFGVGSGILTVGMLMIGIGHIQSTSELLGMKFWARENTGITDVHEGQQHALWVPAHTWTVDFYEFLSAGAFYPEFTDEPLAQVNPDLDRQAFGLVRDSYKQGTGRITITPDAVTVSNVAQTDSRYFVTLEVKNTAFDRAQQFILSNSQVRLLAYQGNDVNSGKVSVGHPDRWTQMVSLTDAGATNVMERTLIFDDISHFVTSIPGQQKVTFQLEFPIGNGLNQLAPGAIPRFIQVKGVRFELPPATSFVVTTAPAARGGLSGSTTAAPPPDASAPMASEANIAQRNDIRPINTTINDIIGLEHENRLLVRGEASFPRGARGGGGRETRVNGVAATEGTQIVTVDVSRDSAATINGAARQEAGEEATPMLVDSEGRTYLAKGYLLETPERLTIKLIPETLIQHVSELPHLPTSNANRLRLYFEVTEGVTITSFRLGDVTVCRCNVNVEFK